MSAPAASGDAPVNNNNTDELSNSQSQQPKQKPKFTAEQKRQWQKEKEGNNKQQEKDGDDTNNNNNNNNKQDKETKKKPAASDKKDSSSATSAAAAASQPPSGPKATHISLHFALATRVPKERGGGIMSIAAVAFNPETRQIIDTFERNVLPAVDGEVFDDKLHNHQTNAANFASYVNSFDVGVNAASSFPSIMSPDTLGYWASATRRKEFKAVTENAIHPKLMMEDFLAFCKKSAGGGSQRITLICNPLGAFFSFVLHYQERFCPTAAPNYGFGALCVRSFLAGVLNCSLAQVTTNKMYLEEWTEGFDPNQTLQPIAQAVVAALVFTHGFNYQQQQQQQQQLLLQQNKQVQWLCPIPPAAAKGYSIPDPLSSELKNPHFEVEVKKSTNAKSSTTPACKDAKQQQEKTESTAAVAEVKNENIPLVTAPSLLFYPSITDADFAVDQIEKNILTWAKEHPEVEWIAQEKVHGSNFSVAFDANDLNTIYAARREAPLTIKDGPSFYGFDYLVTEIKSELQTVVRNIIQNENNNTNKSLRLVQFFGEICGGDYDDRHRVSPVIGASRVQRGVLYSNVNVFYVFDCVLHYNLDDGSSSSSQQVARYLTYDEVAAAFSKNIITPSQGQKQLLLAPVLARGTFENLNTNVSCEFESAFSSWVGLPNRNENKSLAKNFAEGIILRPANLKQPVPLPLSILAKSTKTSDDAATQLPQQKQDDNDNKTNFFFYRPLVKKKHPMFREFSATGSGGADLLAHISVQDLPFRLITVARVASVISKMTKNERENEAKIVESMVKDILKDAKEVLKSRKTSAASDDQQQQQQQNSSNIDDIISMKNDKVKNAVELAVKSYIGSSF